MHTSTLLSPKKVAGKLPIILAVAGTLALGVVARADLLGQVFKGGLVAVAVKQFARPLNDGINRLTDSAGAPMLEATKVVPIVSIGQGGYVGAAQVSGPKAQVDQVQAVGMIEGSLAGREFRMKALVPIATTSPSKNGLRRVKGVGVSAIIDVRV